MTMLSPSPPHPLSVLNSELCVHQGLLPLFPNLVYQVYLFL